MSIQIYNITEFFNRPIMLYSLGDIRFQKPISLQKAVYILGFFMVWTVPIFFMFGLVFSPPALVITLLPPIIIGHLATKPVFGGMQMFDFLAMMRDFAFEPRGWTDGEANNMREPVYELSSDVWISRRKDLQILADLVEGKAHIITKS